MGPIGECSSSNAEPGVSHEENGDGRQEIESNSSDEPVVILTDIPALCLDRILSNLSLDDLTNVADSNKTMNASALRVFNLHYRDNFIDFAVNKTDRLFWSVWDVDRTIKVSQIHDKANILPALNHFGANMTAIRISLENPAILEKFLEKCPTNVTELYIQLGRCDLVVNQTFENVRKFVLTVHGSNIDESWTKIPQFFPALRSFEIRNFIRRSEFIFHETFIDYIPNLEHFSYSGHSERSEQLRKIGRFINANRHVSALYLDNHTSELCKLQTFIEWDSLAVRRLSIQTNDILDVGYLDQLQNLRSLKLLAAKYGQLRDMELRNLEELEIFLRDRYEYPFVDYRLQCRQLKRLTIQLGIVMKNEEHVVDSIENLATDFRQIEGLGFIMCERTFGDNWRRLFRAISSLVLRCSSLIKIHFKVETHIPSQIMKIREFNWQEFIPYEIRNWEMLVECKCSQAVGVSTDTHVSFINRNGFE